MRGFFEVCLLIICHVFCGFFFVYFVVGVSPLLLPPCIRLFRAWYAGLKIVSASTGGIRVKPFFLGFWGSISAAFARGSVHCPCRSKWSRLGVVDVVRTAKKWSRCGVVDIGRGLVRVGEGGEGMTFQSSFLFRDVASRRSCAPEEE